MNQNLWLIGALIVFLGTFPILFEMNILWKINGFFFMGIGGILIFYLMSK